MSLSEIVNSTIDNELNKFVNSKKNDENKTKKNV